MNKPSPNIKEIQALHQAGRLEEAREAYLALLQKDPEFAAGWNNLGTVYFKQGKWEEAAAAFQSAINIQANYADAYYNLGLVYTKLNKQDEALRVYEALIRLSPQHAGGLFQLGCLLMRKEQHKQALSYFLTLLTAYPNHLETLSNLASCYLILGMLDEAKSYYEQALAVDEKDTQILFNLGVISAEQGRLDNAISYYERAVALDLDFYAAHHNLGAVYLALKKTEQALAQFKEALRLNPADTAVQHTINVLTHQGDLSSSPPAYIRSLFDSYADHYDEHLTQVLHYDVPSMFLQTLQDARGMQMQWDVLDLGCGTGLCGEKIKPLARTLIGVDLSEKMLAVAARKKIYAELIATDVLSYLQDKQQAFDLIIAGDVLVYFGDLEQMFALARQALKPQGLFIFNLEISTEENYAMTASGRFAHAKKYVDALAREHQFKVLRYREIMLREQQHRQVMGYMYLLERSPQ